MSEVLREIMKRSESSEEADFVPSVFGKYRKVAPESNLPVLTSSVEYSLTRNMNKILCEIMKPCEVVVRPCVFRTKEF